MARFYHPSALDVGLVHHLLRRGRPDVHGFVASLSALSLTCTAMASRSPTRVAAPFFAVPNDSHVQASPGRASEAGTFAHCFGRTSATGSPLL